MVPDAIRNILERSRIENCIRLFAENAHCLMPNTLCIRKLQTIEISLQIFASRSRKCFDRIAFFSPSRTPANNAMRTLEQKISPRHFFFVIFVCAFSKLNIWHYSTLWVWNWIHGESFEHKFNVDYSGFLNRERTNREPKKIWNYATK